jgi:hypothetical protein
MAQFDRDYRYVGGAQGGYYKTLGYGQNPDTIWHP